MGMFQLRGQLRFTLETKDKFRIVDESGV